MKMPTDALGRILFVGSWVKVWTPILGGIWHHGIVSSITMRADQTYAVTVIHNTKDNGVVETSLDTFRDHRQIFLHKQPQTDEHQGWILASARINIGQPYSWFSQNCEHLCSFCYTWRPKSETLEAGATVAAVLAAVLVGAVLWKD